MSALSVPQVFRSAKRDPRKDGNPIAGRAISVRHKLPGRRIYMPQGHVRDTTSQVQDQTAHFPEIDRLCSELRTLTALVAKLVEKTLEPTAVAGERRSAGGGDKELHAILLLAEIGPHPVAIAKTLGIRSHQTMLRWPKFQRYLAMARQSTGTPTRGFKTDDGIEAIDD